MSRIQRERIADLEEELRVVRASIPRLIEEACDEVRAVAQGQGDDARGRAIRTARTNRTLEKSLDRQHRLIDHVTEMDTPQMLADLEKAGADYHRWRADHGLVTCRVKQRGVVS